jgi:hypothetical protein
MREKVIGAKASGFPEARASGTDRPMPGYPPHCLSSMRFQSDFRLAVPLFKKYYRETEMSMEDACT